ncbi:hypothetical protein ABH932_002412 [Streptacidiphilus sp. MAP5-52]
MHQRWNAEQAAIWAIAAPGAASIGLLGWDDINLEQGTAEIPSRAAQASHSKQSAAPPTGP